MCETPSFVTMPPTNRYYSTKGLCKNKTLPPPPPPPPQPNTLPTIETKGNDVRRTKFVKL